MNFEAFTLTRAGRKVLAQGQTGLPIRFTRVMAGDGEVPPGTVIEEMTELVHPLKDLPINGNTIIGDGTTQLDCVLSNKGLPAMMELREIGVFARDNDGGAEVLYSYMTAWDLPDHIPAGNGPNVVELLVSIVTVIMQAENIVVDIAEGYGFVTSSQLETRFLDLFGPHTSPVGLWTYDETAPKKLRPTPIFAQQSVLIGWNPDAKDFFFFPADNLLRRSDRLSGGTLAMATADYPDGNLYGGDLTMAVEDYPDGQIFGGDAYTF